MKKLILASNNAKKVKEIKEILKGLPIEVRSLKDEGIDIDVVEDGKTFEENAKKKAKEIYEFLLSKGKKDFIVLADDSGLEIDALNGEPGIYSSRYLGEDTSYVKKNSVILERLKDVPEEKRSARFVCAVAAVFPDGQTKVIRGTMEGIIGYEIKGENGFGYDPIFYLPQYGKYSAELSSDEKNAISHRGEALRRIREVL